MSIWILIIATLHILGILSAIKAVMESRTSQGAIAWVIFLITFPYVSLPVYWIFGRSRFHGYKQLHLINDSTVKQKLSNLLDELKEFVVEPSEMTEADAAATKLAYFPILHSNDVELLIDGNATFDSILNGIRDANSYILFQFYIVKDDEIGNRVKDALIAKAEDGVKIYFLYDEIGSHKLSKSYKQSLREAGIEAHAFDTQKGLSNRFQINFRNHRKVVMIDGRYAWIGGHNVGDEYLGKSKKFGHWRDTHVKIEGPAVMAAQLSFIQDWHWATNRVIDMLNWIPKASSKGDMEVLIIPSGPADKLETASLMFNHAINSARKRIWITSPYFVPDDATLAALQLAGLRGVDVRILIPDKPDHLLVFLAAYTYFEEVAETGVRFFRYTNGFLHQKVMLIDDYIATVGTANFDNRSFRLNFEITSVIRNQSFIEQIEKMLLDDIAHSREMNQEDLKKMSFWFRLSTRLARLTSPIQ